MATPAEILTKMNELQSEFSEFQRMKADRQRAITARDSALQKISELDIQLAAQVTLLQTIRTDLKALL